MTANDALRTSGFNANGRPSIRPVPNFSDDRCDLVIDRCGSTLSNG